MADLTFLTLTSDKYKEKPCTPVSEPDYHLKITYAGQAAASDKSKDSLIHGKSKTSRYVVSGLKIQFRGNVHKNSLAAGLGMAKI